MKRSGLISFYVYEDSVEFFINATRLTREQMLAWVKRLGAAGRNPVTPMQTPRGRVRKEIEWNNRLRN